MHIKKGQMTDEIIKWLLLLLVTSVIIILLIKLFGGFKIPLRLVSQKTREII